MTPVVRNADVIRVKRTYFTHPQFVETDNANIYSGGWAAVFYLAVKVLGFSFLTSCFMLRVSPQVSCFVLLPAYDAGLVSPVPPESSLRCVFSLCVSVFQVVCVCPPVLCHR